MLLLSLLIVGVDSTNVEIELPPITGITSQ